MLQRLALGLFIIIVILFFTFALSISLVLLFVAIMVFSIMGWIFRLVSRKKRGRTYSNGQVIDVEYVVVKIDDEDKNKKDEIS